MQVSTEISIQCESNYLFALSRTSIWCIRLFYRIHVPWFPFTAVSSWAINCSKVEFLTQTFFLVPLQDSSAAEFRIFGFLTVCLITRNDVHDMIVRLIVVEILGDAGGKDTIILYAGETYLTSLWLLWLVWIIPFYLYLGAYLVTFFTL